MRRVSAARLPARAGARPPWGFSAPFFGEAAAQLRHLDGDADRFRALVLARDRLLLVVGGEDAVGDGLAELELHVHQAARRLVGDDLEVVGVAADDRADRGERVEAPRFREPLQSARDLERARDRLKLGLLAQARHLGTRGIEESLADLLVEAGMNDADARSGHRLALRARRPCLTSPVLGSP